MGKNNNSKSQAVVNGHPAEQSMGKITNKILKIKIWPKSPAVKTLLIILGIAVFGAVAYMFWKKVTYIPPELNKPVSTIIDESIKAASHEENGSSKALDLLSRKSKYTNSDAEKNELLYAQAVVYTNNKNYTKAIEIYKQLEAKYGINTDLAFALAGNYESSGDKQNALVYYKKGLELLQQQKGEDLPSGIYFYQQKIKSLGG